jgi:hypothetical protein
MGSRRSLGAGGSQPTGSSLAFPRHQPAEVERLGDRLEPMKEMGS